MPETQPLSLLDRAARSRLLPNTPVTLLQRIRDSRDPAAWDDLVRLLAPLVDHWSRRSLPDRNDRADVAQEVFLELSKRLPAWDYDSSRSFRAWLRTVTRSKCVDRFRQRGERAAEYELSQIVAAESPDELEIQERALLARAALRLLKGQVREDVWAIFRQHVLEEEPAAAVAGSSGVEVNYVYLVRSRLLAKLRALLANLRD
jgi:RNA polymerase sigma-70 factor, ECF subfamily